MKYNVRITAAAKQELQDAYLYIVDDAGIPVATEWRLGLYAKIQGMEEFPRRFGYALEHDHSSLELRQALYYSHRIIFTIYEDSVFILHVRHTSRKQLKKKKIGSVLEEE